MTGTTISLQTRNHAVDLSSARLEAMTPLRCLLVDDHPAIRAGLRELLSAEPGFEVVEAVATAQAAVAFAERNELDVAVVDYQLGGHSGLWASRKLKQVPGPPAVVIYSAFCDHVLAAACVVADADALVSKASLGSELCDEIRRAADGLTRLPPVPPSLGESMRRRLEPDEQAIFGMLLAGIPAREVATVLDIDPESLEPRLWALLRKLERLDPVP